MKFNPSSGTAKAITLVALSLLVALLALPGTTYAQSMTGSLSGSVVDESGGVIPGADVTVINEASKGVRRSVTNADGFFAFASLPAATYTVQVSIAGFNTYEVTGIELRSGDSRSLRQIAAQGRDRGRDRLGERGSGPHAAQLGREERDPHRRADREHPDHRHVRGRGPPPAARHDARRRTAPATSRTSAARSTASTATARAAQQSAVGNYSANGNRTWALDITIDGAPGADPGCNCATSVNPNTEFVQEFKVLQSNFSAEHAKGPVAMSVISKSGGRDFHGSVFGYLRDYHLNSNEWFANKVGAERVKNKFTYPGFTISGPLLIPGTDFNKNRDKVFFFAGFEYFGQAPRHRLRQVVGARPPSMRTGNFSNAAAVGLRQLRQHRAQPPRRRSCRPTMIDPGGQALLNVFPQPNANPAHDRRLQLRRQPPDRPERLAGPRAPRLQHLRQHEAVRALQHPARDAALRDRPLVEERRAPAALPVPDQRARTSPTRSRPA